MYSINVRYVYTLLALTFGALMIWRMARERAAPGSTGPAPRDPSDIEIPFTVQIVIAAILLVVGGVVAFGVFRGWFTVYIPDGCDPALAR